jgi:hypothetical protein
LLILRMFVYITRYTTLAGTLAGPEIYSGRGVLLEITARRRRRWRMPPLSGHSGHLGFAVTAAEGGADTRSIARRPLPITGDAGTLSDGADITTSDRRRTQSYELRFVGNRGGAA